MIELCFYVLGYSEGVLDFFSFQTFANPVGHNARGRRGVHSGFGRFGLHTAPSPQATSAGETP